MCRGGAAGRELAPRRLWVRVPGGRTCLSTDAPVHLAILIQLWTRCCEPGPDRGEIKQMMLIKSSLRLGLYPIHRCPCNVESARNRSLMGTLASDVISDAGGGGGGEGQGKLPLQQDKPNVTNSRPAFVQSRARVLICCFLCGFFCLSSFKKRAESCSRKVWESSTEKEQRKLWENRDVWTALFAERTREPVV